MVTATVTRLTDGFQFKVYGIDNQDVIETLEDEYGSNWLIEYQVNGIVPGFIW